MPDPREAARLLPLVREYASLDRKRQNEGVTPREYQRWLDLKQRLDQRLPSAPPTVYAEKRRGPRIPTRLLVHYESLGALRQAVIRNISRGGLFIETAFTPAIGTPLLLRLRVGDCGEDMELPAEVVSVNLRPDLSSRAPGMGVKFANLSPEQQAAVDRLFERARAEIR